MSVSYVVRRVGLFFVVLWCAATVNFVIPRLAPGNPIRSRVYLMATQGGYLATPAAVTKMVDAYDKIFGLNKPILGQYVQYLWNTAHFNFGYSLAQYPAKVFPMIMRALPWTIGLLFVATLLGFSIGTLLGALMAWTGSPKLLRYLVGPLLTLSSIPYYLLGLILVYLAAVSLKVLPLSGGYTLGTFPSFSFSFIVDVVRHAILPACSIILSAIGFWAIGMRGMMITTEGEDYMTFAEAKGLPGRWIFYRYALRNAILPQVTAVAISLGYIVSGSVLVEVVFGYPGIGTLLYQAISSSDYYVIYGIVFMIILSISLATLIIDLIYPLLDPRITYRSK